MAWATGSRHSGSTPTPAEFQSVFEELASRAAQLPIGSNDHELILTLRSKQILTTTNAWNYDHQEKILKPSSRDPISSEDASKMIQRIHQIANQPELIHSSPADASRSVGPELQCGDSMAARHLAPQPGLSGVVRPPHEAYGQWPDPVDSSAAEAIDPAAVTPGPGSGPVSQALRTSLLDLCLGNEANDCFMNTVLLAELWACCMDRSFSWGLTGDWMQPLLRMLDRGPSTQWITDPDCLGPLLASWYEFHAMGIQHDAAEFSGWLRQSQNLHKVRFADVMQAPRWRFVSIPLLRIGV